MPTTFTQEQVAKVANEFKISEAEALASLQRDAERRAKKAAKAKAALLAKGAQEPIGAKPDVVKPETIVPKPSAPGAKLVPAQFAIRAITKLRKPPYKGIHTVYSGFNGAWKDYFGKESDPIAAVKELVASGVLEGRGAKGGYMIYLPGDAPASGQGASVLGKILDD